MRNPLILAALLTFAGPAAAQPAQPPAPLALTSAQRAELQQITVRGRALAVLVQAARLSTQDMLTRVPNPEEAGIVGWIGQVEGNGVAITYFAKEGDGFAAVYRAQLLGNRVTSPQVHAAGSRPMLTGVAARMAAARVAVGEIERQPCGGDFNAVVLPPEGDAPLYVYRLSPRTETALPGGGHFRFAVGPDGVVGEETVLGAATCSDIPLPAAPAGAANDRARPLQINATSAEWPNELHVFFAAITGRPVVVAAGRDPTRLWGVTGQGIAELRQ